MLALNIMVPPLHVRKQLVPDRQDRDDRAVAVHQSLALECKLALVDSVGRTTVTEIPIHLQLPPARQPASHPR